MIVPLTIEFPSKADLLNSNWRNEAVEELYDLWKEAHREAMELAKELPNIFGDPPRPLITQHVALGYDDEWFLSQERGEELTSIDREKNWQEVTNEKCAEFQEYFSFSDPEGWRFYLPAYIRHYLSEFPLCLMEAVRMACESKKILHAFNTQQVEFISRFMELCRIWED